MTPPGEEPVNAAIHARITDRLDRLETARNVTVLHACERLLTTVDDAAVRDAVATLLARKRDGHEREGGPRRPVIHDVVGAEIDRQRALEWDSPASGPAMDPRNAFFRDVLGRYAAPALP